MLSKARSCAVIGLEGALVEVEVDIANGLAAFSIVGLPDTAVNEAKDRVRAAIKNSGMLFPFKRITVNLAPADLRKEGPAYDLPIAIGVLLASGQINPINPLDNASSSESYPLMVACAIPMAFCPWSLSPARNMSTLSSCPPPTPWRHLYSAACLSIP